MKKFLSAVWRILARKPTKESLQAERELVASALIMALLRNDTQNADIFKKELEGIRRDLSRNYPD